MITCQMCGEENVQEGDQSGYCVACCFQLLEEAEEAFRGRTAYDHQPKYSGGSW